MRETSFIRQNKAKWGEFEDILNEDKKDPDKLSNLFIQITDDLSFSRTFYPNRYVRVYLNNLAQRVFLNLYKNKKEKRGRLFQFWKNDLPLLIYSARREFLLSTCVFLLSFGIGVFSSIHDPDFARLILGEEYVNMTIENIKSGDPMKVYKEMNGMEMLMGITFNNMKVAFMTFIFGILFAVGTVAILLYNGIMVGTFQYFFIEHDLFRESFLTIWMHGTLEISAIIIAGAAGLVLGKGLVFPGTFSRMQSLLISARKSLKILIGIVPIIITAAIIESFFTRFTDVPDFVRLMVIVSSAFLILVYFVWYPFQQAKKITAITEVRQPAVKEQHLDITEIRNNGEIFGDVFIFLRHNLKKLAATSFIIAVCCSTGLWLLNPHEWREAYLFSTFSFLNLGVYFDYTSATIFALNTFAFAINGTVIYWLLIREIKNDRRHNIRSQDNFLRFYVSNFYKSFFASLLLNSVFLLPVPIAIILFCLLLPTTLLWLFCSLYEPAGPLRAVKKIFPLITGSFLRIFGLFVILSTVTFIFYFFLDSPVVWILVEVFQWNVVLEQDFVNMMYAFIMRLFTFFSIHLLLVLMLAGFGLQYFSLMEITSAGWLKQRIQALTPRNHQ